MRWTVLVVLLLSTAAATPVAEDDSGDVSSSLGAPAPGTMAEIDLVSLDVLEDPQAVHLRVGVQDLNDDSEAGMLAVAVELDFQHNGAHFHIYIGRNNVFGSDEYFSFMSAVDPATGRSSGLGQLDLEVDTEEDTFTVSIPRMLLRDGSGAPPFPGRALDDLVVTSYANRITRGGFNIMGVEAADGHYTDRMPDDGTARFQFELGVRQSGVAALASEEPFRASNGEATTYVFKVRASNDGAETAGFRFNASSVPNNWDISLPDGVVEIGANRAITVPVIVSTAFAHNHGSTESFILEMEHIQDRSSVGRVELGVHYPLIPQPAGHHDTLWVHALSDEQDPFSLLNAAFGGAGVDAYVNALEDDDRANEPPIPGYRCGFGLQGDTPSPTMGYCWDLPLDPGLQLGLDFDLLRTGTADLQFSSELPMSAATVSGEVVYRAPFEGSTGDPGPPGGPQPQPERIVLAIINGSATKDVSSNTGFELTIHPTPESDFIPYVAGASLSVVLRIEATRADNPFFGPSTLAPTLSSGGRFTLPLNEYADPVEDVVSIGTVGLTFAAVTEQERRINPGETAIFKALLENAGNATEVDINIIGANRAWATLLTASSVVVDGSSEVIVAVAVPEDASNGEVADLIVEASNVEDIEDKSLIRFVATVDDSEDLPDEAETAAALTGSADKQSPGLPVLALLGALAIALRRK